MSQISSVRSTKWARVFWLPYMVATLLLAGCATKNNEPPTAAATTNSEGDVTVRDDVQGQKVPVTTKRSP